MIQVILTAIFGTLLFLGFSALMSKINSNKKDKDQG